MRKQCEMETTVDCDAWEVRCRAEEKAEHWTMASRRVYSGIVRPVGGDIRRPTINVGPGSYDEHLLFGRLGRVRNAPSGIYARDVPSFIVKLEKPEGVAGGRRLLCPMIGHSLR
jgi:hypothetical protein